MQALYASYSASISELKRNPSLLLREAGDEPIAILNHNTPSAYLLSAVTFEKMIELLEESDLIKVVRERIEGEEVPVKVSFDEL